MGFNAPEAAIPSTNMAERAEGKCPSPPVSWRDTPSATSSPTSSLLAFSPFLSHCLPAEFKLPVPLSLSQALLLGELKLKQGHSMGSFVTSAGLLDFILWLTGSHRAGEWCA